jgi:hypothetical protein
MATFDTHKNFAYSRVNTVPSPAISGTTLIVSAGEGARFPVPPFNVTIWPIGVLPIPTNAEIVRVTAISTDTFTIARSQESSTARTIIVGDQIALTITAKKIQDIQTQAAFKTDANSFTESQSVSKNQDGISAVSVYNLNVSTFALSTVQAVSDTTFCSLIAYSSGNVTTPVYGVPVAGMAELVANNGNGLLIGTGINAKPIIFGTTNAERLRISSSGGLSLGTTTDPGTGAFISTGLHTLLGGQIKFPATQNASSDANTLDDYEEGTWTPALVCSGGGTPTYSQRFGLYIKVGRLVAIEGRISLSSLGGGTGSISIAGLPFTVTSSNSTLQVGYSASIAGAGVWMGGYVASGTTTAQLIFRAAAATPWTTVMTTTDAGATFDVVFSFHYTSTS